MQLQQRKQQDDCPQELYNSSPSLLVEGFMEGQTWARIWVGVIPDALLNEAIPPLPALPQQLQYLQVADELMPNV